MMPTQQSKPVNNQQQMIISGTHGQSIVMNHHHHHHHPQQQLINANEMLHIEPQRQQLMIQASNLMPTQQSHLIQSSGNQNFIVGSSNNMQQVLLNNSHLMATPNSGLMHQNGQQSLVQPVPTGSKVNILNGPSIINGGNGLISPNGGTVVLQNSFMMQPQHHTFTTVDGQVLNVINPDPGTTQYLTQSPQPAHQRIILSPDSKRRARKRKSSSTSPLTPINSSSPQSSPNNNIQQQSPNTNTTTTTTMLQITPQYQHHQPQSFQISPGLSSGITLLQKTNNQQQTHPGQQQILLQNGQTLIQPLNLMGQQLLVPTGLMVAPDNTLLQIQNVSPCGSIITPQGMMIRAPSPHQNKQFLSPGQQQHNQQQQQQQMQQAQFIVNGNGQISPLGHAALYSTSMGLVMPQQQQQVQNSGSSSSSGSGYMQQNSTIVQQHQQHQSTIQSNNKTNHELGARIDHHTKPAWANQQQQHNQNDSPPDTTTHSPNSPVRPSSQRSSGSDSNMVKYICFETTAVFT